MKRLMILGIITCVGLLLAQAAFAGDPQGPPGGLGVEIVNPLPLPVTGNVGAVQEGEWDVRVTNSSADPVNVCDVCDDPCTREPVTIYDETQMGTAATTLRIYEHLDEDRWLVIQSISVFVRILPDWEITWSYVTFSTDDTIYNFLFDMPLNCYAPTTTSKRCAGTLAATAYVDSDLYYVMNTLNEEAFLVRYALTGYMIEKTCPRP